MLSLIDRRKNAGYEGGMRTERNSFAVIFATWFGAGFFPWGPGTAGSLAGLPFIFIIKMLTGNIGHLLSTICVCFFGWWVAEKYLQERGGSDPQEVVIDEVVGLSIALLFAPLSWLSFLLGFVFFRIFDIFKPWPVGWADTKVKGGLGIMLDDILAGLMAMGVLQGMIYLGAPL
jgi:phosphatidylglycerophosphatase A